MIEKHEISQKNILILDAGSSQGLPIMRSLYKSGNRVIIVGPNRFCAGFFSRYAHQRIIWPSLYSNEHETFKRLTDYLINHKTDLVLGLGDKTAHLLSKYKRDLEQYTKLIVPDYAVFSIAADKMKTMRFAMDNGISCPLTLDGDEIEISKIESLIGFPVIVKPKIGVGSIGVRKYCEPENLKRDFLKLKQTFGSLLIQEFIPNEEQYTIEAFCDKYSKVRTCIVIKKTRFVPVTGGTSSCNVTISKPDIEVLVRNFLEKLRWIGNANLDVIYDRKYKIAKIIEINPRVGAMVRIAFESGIDIAKMQYQLAFEPNVNFNNRYKEEIILRNMFLELIWAFSISSRKILHTKPFFFSFFNKNIFYQNIRLDDPLTPLGYLFGNLIKYINPINFRMKFTKSSKVQKLNISSSIDK